MSNVNPAILESRDFIVFTLGLGKKLFLERNLDLKLYSTKNCLKIVAKCWF